MNPAFKHLEDKLRIGELTILQWAGVLIGVVVAGVWGTQLSPFGTYITLITAFYMGGIPAAAAVMAGAGEFNVGLHLRAFLQWRRSPGRYLPGPGENARGYTLLPDTVEQRHLVRESTPDLDLTELWQS